MQLLNNNCLVKLKSDSKIMGNGISVKETRGKRDIVSGTILEYDAGKPSHFLNKGLTIWFPLYAATAIVMEGVEYLIVNFNDIMIIE